MAHQYYNNQFDETEHHEEEYEDYEQPGGFIMGNMQNNNHGYNQYEEDNDGKVGEPAPPPISAPTEKCEMKKLYYEKDVGPLWNNIQAQKKIKQWDEAYENENGYKGGTTGQWQTYKENWNKTSHAEFYEIRYNCHLTTKRLENNGQRKQLLQDYIEPDDQSIKYIAKSIRLGKNTSFEDKFNVITWVVQWIQSNIKFNIETRGIGLKVGEVLNKFRYGCCIEFAHIAVSLLRCIGFSANEVFVVIGTHIRHDNKFHAYVATSFYGYVDPSDKKGILRNEKKWAEIYRYNDITFWENPKATKSTKQGAIGFICGL